MNGGRDAKDDVAATCSFFRPLWRTAHSHIQQDDLRTPSPWRCSLIHPTLATSSDSQHSATPRRQHHRCHGEWARFIAAAAARCVCVCVWLQRSARASTGREARTLKSLYYPVLVLVLVLC